MKSVLAILGTIFGLAHLAVSILAIQYLRDSPTVSRSDRSFGWAFYWFLEPRKYGDAGKRLCVLGGLTFVAGAASWIGWLFA